MSDLDVADFIAERMKKDPKVQNIVADAHLFDGLRQQPGWQRLFERIKLNKDKFMSALAHRLMAGEKVSDEEIAYYRGFYQGAVWVISHPEMAEKNLERAATLAWMMTQQEIAEREEEDSPYVEHR